ncbi:Xylose isomerase-like TIM barrel [Maioricimonas rarisocia]|uniref:Xylose isomerase-like TIM barrel n=1 Tax=Maioricimonas rarisocia TaxID=2528026 RepID=A0A517Z2B0_9PLAN|nr:TIM barrel protein [Maioricimonas rarisocia]QDU36614.1 Xylose isomerase-like TIM barrel [Maioricimonas rarisocia]
MRLLSPSVRRMSLVFAGLLFAVAVAGSVQGQEDATAAKRLDDPDRLVAWCVVPFDANKRGPRERAEMLERLGFHKLAYDWRAEHVPTFEEEILELKQHGIEFFAFWSVHEEAFRLFEKHGIAPQIWKTAPSPKADSQEARVAAAGRQMLPLVERTRQAGCKLGLYNHGGWGGEPANLVAVCRWLRENADADHVGIVYNLHHGHGHIDDFATSLAAMQPYLLCLNLNGMNDNARPKIVSLGRGQHEKKLLEVIRESGYDGPIGLLDHRNEMDAEQSLRENLDGLRELTAELNSADN